MPTRLRDLGRSLETTADERPDLLLLARQTVSLLNLIETGVPPDDLDSEHRALAGELFRRRGLI
jgi:hypothetical protein